MNHSTTGRDNAVGDWLAAEAEAGDAKLGRAAEAFLLALEREHSAPGAGEAVAQVLVAEARRLLPDTRFLVTVPGTSPHRQRVVAAAGLAGAPLGGELAVGTGAFAEAADRGGVVEGLAGGVTVNDQALFGHCTARVAALPVVTDGRAEAPLPGLFAAVREGADRFSRADRRLVDGVARLVRLELQRSRIHLATAEAADRMTLAVDVAIDLAGSTQPGEVVPRLLERAVHAVDADRGTLCRVVDAQLTVEACYHRWGEVQWLNRLHPIEEFPAAVEALTTEQPVFILRPQQELLPPALREALGEVRHAVMLPLRLDQQLVALLLVCRCDDRPFSTSEVATLTMVGEVAVLALRNVSRITRAEEAVRAKSTFLNMAAHELRTPLSVVNGYISMLHEGVLGDVPQAWARPLDVISEKSGELGALVEDLLIAARVEGGGMVANPKDVDLRDLARHAVERASGRAELMGASLELDHPTTPVPVDVDPLQIGRVLDNLVNNALNYCTHDPHVELVVRGGSRPTVLVRDNGVGIAPAKRHQVFERFARLQDAASPRRPGTGLGLPLARELAERNGGSLRLAASEPGAGSTFELALPARSASVVTGRRQGGTG